MDINRDDTVKVIDNLAKRGMGVTAIGFNGEEYIVVGWRMCRDFGERDRYVCWITTDGVDTCHGEYGDYATCMAKFAVRMRRLRNDYICSLGNV